MQEKGFYCVHQLEAIAELREYGCTLFALDVGAREWRGHLEITCERCAL
jgi:hypothetical protein